MQIMQNFGQEPTFSRCRDLEMLVYMSDLTASQKSADKILAGILEDAIPANAHAEISGMLYFHNGRFIQVLEAQPANLERAMGRITNAKSHCNIDIVLQSPIEERSFYEWNMGALDFGRSDEIDPAFFHKVVDLYQQVLSPRADRLMDTFKLLQKDADFAGML